LPRADAFGPRLRAAQASHLGNLVCLRGELTFRRLQDFIS
jgi:hypothetical protein